MCAIHECGTMSGSYAYSLPSVVLLAEFTKLIISSLDLQQVPNTPLKNHCHFGAFAKMPIRSIIFTSHVWLPGCVSGLAFLTAEKGSVFQVSFSWIVLFWRPEVYLICCEMLKKLLKTDIIHFLPQFSSEKKSTAKWKHSRFFFSQWIFPVSSIFGCQAARDVLRTPLKSWPLGAVGTV